MLFRSGSFTSAGQKPLLAPSHCLHVCYNAGARVSVFERSGEAWAADNLPLLPYYHYSHLRRSQNRKPSRYEDCRNATEYIKVFARFYDTIPHKKSSTVFPADFATSSVERKFGSFRAQDKNPFLPHLTACTYLTIQVHKFPFSNGRSEARGRRQFGVRTETLS